MLRRTKTLLFFFPFLCCSLFIVFETVLVPRCASWGSKRGGSRKEQNLRVLEETLINYVLVRLYTYSLLFELANQALLVSLFLWKACLKGRLFFFFFLCVCAVVALISRRCCCTSERHVTAQIQRFFFIEITDFTKLFFFFFIFHASFALRTAGLVRRRRCSHLSAESSRT